MQRLGQLSLRQLHKSIVISYRSFPLWWPTMSTNHIPVNRFEVLSHFHGEHRIVNCGKESQKNPTKSPAELEILPARLRESPENLRRIPPQTAPRFFHRTGNWTPAQGYFQLMNFNNRLAQNRLASLDGFSYESCPHSFSHFWPTSTTATVSIPSRFQSIVIKYRFWRRPLEKHSSGFSSALLNETQSGRSSTDRWRKSATNRSPPITESPVRS